MPCSVCRVRTDKEFVACSHFIRASRNVEGMGDSLFHDPTTRRDNRRAFLAGTATGAAGMAAAGLGAYAWWNWPTTESPRRLGIPGEYPGRVVEVQHPGAVKNLKRDRAAVKQMMDRGLCDLVGGKDAGCEDATEAWRKFFSPGDRVGIKVVPVGRPHSISSLEVVQEIIAGLQSAGVRRGDILVFERYKDEFLACGYDAILPDGVHWECSSVQYEDKQVRLDGQREGRYGKESRIAGYDRDVYQELAFCSPDHDQQDDRSYRSHLSTIVTRKVDKFISVPVLKDHRSAGVTLCLKNLSHGLVNNVARSHILFSYNKWQTHAGNTLNQCGTFIPAMASLRPTREKAVLQILDGLVGTYEGGPGNWNSTFATWEYKSLLFATDPVALDHVGWRIIDAKRKSENMPPVAQMGVDAFAGLRDFRPDQPTEQFHIRQPQHIPLAASLGMGVFDMGAIQHQRVRVG